MMRISHAKIWQNGILDNGTEGAKALRYHALGELEIQKKSSMAGRYEIRKGMVQDEAGATSYGPLGVKDKGLDFLPSVKRSHLFGF